MCAYSIPYFTMVRIANLSLTTVRTGGISRRGWPLFPQDSQPKVRHRGQLEGLGRREASRLPYSSSHDTLEGHTAHKARVRHTWPELGTREMRGSKPAGFGGGGVRAARSVGSSGTGASLEQRDLLDDVRRVREHSRGHDAGEVVGEVVRRVEAAVGGAVAPALPA